MPKEDRWSALSPWSEALALSVGLHALLLLAPMWKSLQVPQAQPLLVELLVPEEIAEEEDRTPESAASPATAKAPQDEELQDAFSNELEETTERRERVKPEDELRDQPSETIHVVANESQATESPDQSHRIAQVDMKVEQESRAPTPPLEEGPELEAHSGRSGRVGLEAPEVDRSPNAKEARKGERAEEQAQLERSTPERLRSASGGEGEEEESATASGPEKLANAAGGQEGSEDEGRGARIPNPPSAGTESPAIEEQTPSTTEAPDGWQPTVLFDPSLGMPAPSIVEDQDPERTERPDEETSQAREPLQARVQGAEGDAEQRQQARPSVEPQPEPAVAELDQEGEETPSTAPGWQGEALLADTTRSSVSGAVELQGTPGSTSLTTPEEEVDLDDRTQVSALAHPHAAYMDQIEGIIRSAWLEEMPVDYTALGMQGTTTVRLEVDHRGRVVSKQVLRMSGYPELDAHALEAIPQRLPRPPEGAAEPLFVHQIDFRKNDPWASGL